MGSIINDTRCKSSPEFANGEFGERLPWRKLRIRIAAEAATNKALTRTNQNAMGCKKLKTFSHPVADEVLSSFFFSSFDKRRFSRILSNSGDFIDAGFGLGAASRGANWGAVFSGGDELLDPGTAARENGFGVVDSGAGFVSSEAAPFLATSCCALAFASESAS